MKFKLKLVNNLLKQIVETNKEILKRIEEFYKKFIICDKSYILLLLLSLIAYGYDLFNRTISIDDLARNDYIGSGQGLLKACRWSSYVWNYFFSTFNVSPFIDRLFSLFFLFLSTLLLCYILYIVTNFYDKFVYIAFSSLFISFSLNNEIWAYSGTATLLYGGLFIASYVIIYILLCKRMDVLDILYLSMLMSFVAAGYEASLFVYILLVMFILYINKIIFKNGNYNWFKEGLKYAYILIIGIVIRYLIGYLLIIVNNVVYATNGDTQISWFIYGFRECLHVMIRENFKLYVVNSLIYKPITLFVISLIIYLFITLTNCKSCGDIILSILLLLSMFMVSIISGNEMQYRYSQTVQLFVANVWFIFLFVIYSRLNPIKRIILFIVVIFISFRQSIYCNELLSLNNLRSENEAHIVRNIGYKLESEYYGKKVLFVGDYNFSDFINNQITYQQSDRRCFSRISSLVFNRFKLISEEFVRNDVNSVLNWSRKLSSGQKRMEIYFSYYGFNIKVVDDIDEIYNTANEKIIKNNVKQFEMFDCGDYVVVNLGVD